MLVNQPWKKKVEIANIEQKKIYILDFFKNISFLASRYNSNRTLNNQRGNTKQKKVIPSEIFFFG